MWSSNQLTGDACTITTTDNKNYSITLNPWLTRSDGTTLTVNDVYFSYYDVIKSNMWWIESLDSYGKLEITQLDDGTISVVFPRESIDNQLFFLNSILPAHHLTNQSLEYYQSQFATNPITSACATLKPQNSDKSSIIFDLTNCNDYMSQILQVKQFSDLTWLQSYIQSNPDVIDYVIDGQDDSLNQFGIKSTQALISYFHVNTISDSTRRNLALLFNYALNLEDKQIDGLTPYEGIFTTQWTVDWNTIRRNLWLVQETTNNTIVSTGSSAVQEETPLLIQNILAYWTNKYKTAYLPSQSDKFTVSFKFDQAYDKIAISANWPYKYFPESYDINTKSADYNLSTSFNNLKLGKNTYTVQWYKWDQEITLLTLTIYYGQKPTWSEGSQDTNQVVTNLDWTRTIRIVYVKNPVVEEFIAKLKMALSWNKLSDNFIISSVDNVSQLEDIVSSKAYEVIIRPIDLWSRNDLSILVHDDPMINNAQYKNPTLKNYLADLNQSSIDTQKSLVKSIQDIYRKDMPFMMLGYSVEYIWLSHSIDWMPNKDTNVFTIRDQLLNHIRPIFSLNIDNNVLRNPNNLIKFLIGSHVR